LTRLCPICNSDQCVVRHVEEDVVWGTDGVTKHGRHIFPKVPQDYWECLNCKEQFFDHDQAVAKDAALNELIKEKFGIDWLGRKPRRKRAK
jgi:hypothetical protein